jgi:hypothetical protein
LHGDSNGWLAVAATVMSVLALARAHDAGFQTEFGALARTFMMPTMAIGAVAAGLLAWL